MSTRQRQDGHRGVLAAPEHDALAYIDAHQDEIVRSLCELVRIPSISGSAEENLMQTHLAGQLAGLGLEVDHWQIPLEETTAADGFRGGHESQPRRA